MAEIDPYVKIRADMEKQRRRAEAFEAIWKLFWLIVLVWAATHWPGKALVWLFTFQWITTGAT